MPELPEVETVVRGLRQHVVGQAVSAVRLGDRSLRFPWPTAFADQLLNRTITGITRRAKVINVALDDGRHWLIHLGMTGRLVVEGDKHAHQPGAFYDASSRHEKHDHVWVQFKNSTQLIYNDVRRFGYMKLLNQTELGHEFNGLGPEPLDPNLTAIDLVNKAKTKSTAIKVFIMDQCVLVGVGNIYASEALFRAQIHPARPAKSLNGQDWSRLLAEIRATLDDAILAGGSTLQDYAQVDGKKGGYQAHFQVYDRAGQPCPHCQTPIEKRTQAQRSTYLCTNCQI